MNYTKYRKGKREVESVYRPTGKSYLHVNDNKTLKIDKEYIEYLKTLAREDDNGKCTMCLHNDIRENVHEMLNVYPQHSYIRPHSHPFKTETKTIIEGKLLVVIFDEEGEVLDKFVMEANGVFTFRLDKGIIHTNIPLTDVVFHEVISGPFVGKNDSVFPSWAPNIDETEKIKEYMDNIQEKCGFSMYEEVIEQISIETKF